MRPAVLRLMSSNPDNVRQSILVADRCWGTGYQLGVKTSRENAALQDAAAGNGELNSFS